MKKTTAILLAMFGLASLTMAAESYVYSPNSSIKEQSIGLRAWGNGQIAETNETAISGVYSIRVTTRNYFQGGTIALGNAVNLSDAFAVKGNLLMFSLRIPEVTAANSGGGAAGGAGSGGPSAGAGSGGTGAGGGGGLTEGGGGTSGGGSTTQAAPSTIPLEPLKTIRVIVTTTDGLKSEAFLDVKTSSGTNGWRSVGLPLEAIKGFARTNKTVSGISIAADTMTTFYVGEIKVMNDSTPIYGETTFSEINVGTDQIVTFTGRGTGGVSVLRYEWDFDSSNGVDMDAEGQVVQYRFRKPGTYTVTLTIRDSFGLKKPYQRTIKVTVN